MVERKLLKTNYDNSYKNNQPLKHIWHLDINFRPSEFMSLGIAYSQVENILNRHSSDICRNEVPLTETKKTR